MPAQAGIQGWHEAKGAAMDSRFRVCRFSCHEFCSVAIVASLAHRRVIKSPG